MRSVRSVDLGGDGLRDQPSAMLLVDSHLAVSHPYSDRVTIVDLSDFSKKQVKVPGGPIALAAGEGSDVVYTANNAGGTVSAVNLGRGKRLAMARVGSKPGWLGLNADQNSLMVMNQGSGTLSVVTLSPLLQVARIPIGGIGFNMAFDTVTQSAFIPLATAGTLANIDMSGPVVSSQTKVGRIPTDIAGAGRSLFVTTLKSPNVVVVDTISGSVRKRIPVGNGATKIVASPDNTHALVIRSKPGEVVVLDLQSQRVQGRIDVQGPVDAAFAPDGNTAVITAMAPKGIALKVQVLEAKVLDQVRLGGSVSEVAYTEQGDQVLVLEIRKNRVAVVQP